MAGALILITSKVGNMKDVLDEIRSLELVEESRMLTGPYDIMAIAKSEEMSQITDVLVDQLRQIEGVEDTVTNIYIE